MRDLNGAGEVKTREAAALEILRVMHRGLPQSDRPLTTPDQEEALSDLKGVVLDSLLWICRYGDFPAKGRAAAALECYRGREEDQKWIAVSAAVPLVHTLASCTVLQPLEAAARALRVALECCSNASAQWIVHAGAVSALIRNLSLAANPAPPGGRRLNSEPVLSSLYLLLAAGRTRTMVLGRMGRDGAQVPPPQRDAQQTAPLVRPPAYAL